MRRLALLAALPFLALGGYAVAQTGDETVATQTFTNVVTYTIPTETETVVSTVTVTAPTTTAPPTTTEPEPPPALPVRPVPNVTLNRTTDWNCNSEQNWPIRVNTNIPNNGGGNINGDVQLDAGCTALSVGGQDGTCDLYLNINGNGGNLGSATDGMVIRGAHDLDICGVPGETDLECGAGVSHKDGIQQNSGFRVHFWEIQSGSWANKTTTCHGSGGMFYVSALNNNNGSLIDVVCHYCVMVAGLPGLPGGASLHLGASIDSGARDGCWMGRISNGIRDEGIGIGHVNVNNVGADVDAPGPSPACPALARL